MSDRKKSEILEKEELLLPIDSPTEKIIKKAKTKKVKTLGGNGQADGMAFECYFSRKDVHPFEEIKWEKREATITDTSGNVIFKQTDVEVPSFWSQIATNVVVSKYFSGKFGTSERENSVKHLINRVSRTITNFGKKDGYFASDHDG